MRPMILFSTVPADAATRVNLEVFDSDGPVGEKCMYRLNVDVRLRPESRPDFAAAHTFRLLRRVLDALEAELLADGPSLSQPHMVRQQTLLRTARATREDPGAADVDI